MPWAGSPAGGPGILHILSGGGFWLGQWPRERYAGKKKETGNGTKKWHREGKSVELFLCAGMSAGGTPPTEFSSK